MTAGEQIAGAAVIGGARRRRRPVVLAAKATVCEVCLTDTEVGVCPVDCRTRRDTGRLRED